MSMTNDPAVLLQERRYQEAVEVLEKVAQNGASGGEHAMLGLAYYHLERYPEAREQFAIAVEKEPGNEAWRNLAESAEYNSIAEIDVPVPDFYYFEQDKLLAPAVVPEGALPSPPGPARRPSRLRRLLLWLGNVLGWIASKVMGFLTGAWGRIAGYRDRIWTNWYRHRSPRES